MRSSCEAGDKPHLARVYVTTGWRDGSGPGAPFLWSRRRQPFPGSDELARIAAIDNAIELAIRRIRRVGVIRTVEGARYSGLGRRDEPGASLIANGSAPRPSGQIGGGPHILLPARRCRLLGRSSWPISDRDDHHETSRGGPRRQRRAVRSSARDNAVKAEPRAAEMRLTAGSAWAGG